MPQNGPKSGWNYGDRAPDVHGAPACLHCDECRIHNLWIAIVTWRAMQLPCFIWSMQEISGH